MARKTVVRRPLGRRYVLRALAPSTRKRRGPSGLLEHFEIPVRSFYFESDDPHWIAVEIYRLTREQEAAGAYGSGRWRYEALDYGPGGDRAYPEVVSYDELLRRGRSYVAPSSSRSGRDDPERAVAGRFSGRHPDRFYYVRFEVYPRRPGYPKKLGPYSRPQAEKAALALSIHPEVRAIRVTPASAGDLTPGRGSARGRDPVRATSRRQLAEHVAREAAERPRGYTPAVLRRDYGLGAAQAREIYDLFPEAYGARGRGPAWLARRIEAVLRRRRVLALPWKGAR